MGHGMVTSNIDTQGGLVWLLLSCSVFALVSRDIPGIFVLWLLLCRLYAFSPHAP